MLVGCVVVKKDSFLSPLLCLGITGAVQSVCYLGIVEEDNEVRLSDGWSSQRSR